MADSTVLNVISFTDSGGGKDFQDHLGSKWRSLINTS